MVTIIAVLNVGVQTASLVLRSDSTYEIRYTGIMGTTVQDCSSKANAVKEFGAMSASILGNL